MRSTATRITALSLATIALPALASAASILDLLALANTVLNALIGLAITAAIVAFFWGLIRYLWKSGPDAKTDGLRTMMMGVITIFVMVSIWGLIRLLQSTFQVTSTQPVIPQGIQINAGSYY